MPTTGAGFCPAGSAFAGFGSPEHVAGTAIQIYRDASTGQPGDGRHIDPSTGDYVLDERGRAVGMTEAQQLVVLALSTDIGSSAVKELGSRLKGIKVITDAIQRDVTDVVTDALADGVSRNLLTVDSVEVMRDGNSRVLTRVRWTDLATGKERVSEV